MKKTLLTLVFCFMPVLPAQAVVYWEDGCEVDDANSICTNSHLNETLIPGGSWSFDTNIKHSGGRSVRANFYEGCQIHAAPSGLQCGGAFERQYTPTADSYRRVWMRIGRDSNQGAPTGAAAGGNTHVGCPGCVFERYQPATTKMFENVTTRSPTANDYGRYWLNFGNIGDNTHNLVGAIERAPTPGQAIPISGDVSFAENVWYCVETHEKLNDVGVNNGVLEVWVNDVKHVHRTDLPYRNSGTDANSQWTEIEFIRQGGKGYIWWDDIAVGNEKIGCGATVPDVTTPSPPINLVVR